MLDSNLASLSWTMSCLVLEPHWSHCHSDCRKNWITLEIWDIMELVAYWIIERFQRQKITISTDVTKHSRNVAAIFGRVLTSSTNAVKTPSAFEVGSPVRCAIKLVVIVVIIGDNFLSCNNQFSNVNDNQLLFWIPPKFFQHFCSLFICFDQVETFFKRCKIESHLQG